MTTPLTCPDDHIITRADAEWLMSQGACSLALECVGESVAKAVQANPWAALEYAADRYRALTP